MKRLFSSITALLLTTGCGTVNQEIVNQLSHPDGTVETRSTKNRVWVVGGAKQVVDTVKLSNGKSTQNIGASGMEQESQSPLRDMVDLVREIKGITPVP